MGPWWYVSSNVFVLFSFRDHTYEVLEYCPRTHVYAEPITDEDASRLLNSATSSKNLFYLILLEKRVEFVLATDSVYVPLLDRDYM